LAISPGSTAFKIKVKGAGTKNFVPIQKAFLEMPLQEDLFQIAVLASSKTGVPFQFHVLTHAELQEIWKQSPKTKRDGQPYKEGWSRLDWKWILPHHDRWDKLPS
jgi:hypothetical protein